MPASLIVHGGAGYPPYCPYEERYETARRAATIGFQMLQEGRSAVDVAEELGVIFENDVNFDAGRGSYVIPSGTVEMDALIMDGNTMRSGGVAALKNVANPIKVARRVMDASDHDLIVGAGAYRFAMDQGFPHVPDEDLLVGRELARYNEYHSLGHFVTMNERNEDVLRWEGGKEKRERPEKKDPLHGTVGAVVMDKEGNIAACTSTGGTPTKIPGRVGDSPLVGAGAYAENGIGGSSATGWGEEIIKLVLCKRANDLLESGMDVKEATETCFGEFVSGTGSEGGIVLMDRDGRCHYSYNTQFLTCAIMREGMDEPLVHINDVGERPPIRPELLKVQDGTVPESRPWYLP